MEAFHCVVGLTVFEVKKKVNGGSESLAVGRKKKTPLHSTFATLQTLAALIRVFLWLK